MPVSNKTRKVLWGRSGNRCVICKHELVIDATEWDDESVVGIECHIMSAQKDGPRCDQSYPREKLDSYENLILLCGVHHKMVDDQEDTYTADIVRQMKSDHEVWVADRLTDRGEARPPTLRRVKHNIPAFLSRITTGKRVFDLVMGSYAFSMDHDELKSQEEVDLVGGFLQTVSDWGDLASELEPGERVSAAYTLTQYLQQLENAGFFVFGGREVQVLEGGMQTEPSDWPVSILKVVRKENEEIIHVNPNDLEKEDAQPEDSGNQQ